MQTGLGEICINMSEQKIYQIAVWDEKDWCDIHNLLTTPGSDESSLLCRCIECVDDKKQSKVRSCYRMTEDEARELKNDPRIRFVTIDFSRYPEEFKPPPEEMSTTSPELLQRYSNPVKHFRVIRTFSGANIDPVAVNRCGYQLIRCVQKRDPWLVENLSTLAMIESNVEQYGTGEGVDIIVGDDGCWFGHPEFQNTTSTEHPNGYIGGNVLPGNGTCDLLDLILDGPYYIDPEWFDADPSARLMTRWDGTIVPTDQAARDWWNNPLMRSEKFLNLGSVNIRSGYNRQNCNGSNQSKVATPEDPAIGGFYPNGQHGTPCSALAYGRTQGWAYNANKWVVNLYGAWGTDDEAYNEAMIIFHENKPINQKFGTRDPTISSNSWGYRSNKKGNIVNYSYRLTAYQKAPSDPNPRFIDTLGARDGQRFAGEMSDSPITVSLEEVINSGIIFVAAAGNSSQLNVGSNSIDWNNAISNTTAAFPGDYVEFGQGVKGYVCRRGFPTQGGKFINEKNQVEYPVISIGALDDFDKFGTGQEAIANYSNRGPGVDAYAPADGVLSANQNYFHLIIDRVDSYPGLNQQLGIWDTTFSGTSAACPVAAGFIATIMQWNRDWKWQDVKRWINSLEPQTQEDFFYGKSSTTPNDVNWLERQSLEGGIPRVLYQDNVRTRTLPGTRTVSNNNLNMKNGLGIRIKK